MLDEFANKIDYSKIKLKSAENIKAELEKYLPNEKQNENTKTNNNEKSNERSR